MLGLYMGTIAMGYLIGNYLSGRLSVRVGIDRMLLAGSIVAMLGVALDLLLYALGFLHPIYFFGPIIILGIGNGLTLPNASAGVVSVRPHLAGSASGLGGALMVGVVLCAGLRRRRTWGGWGSR